MRQTSVAPTGLLSRIATLLLLLLSICGSLAAQYAWDPPTNKIVVLAVNAHPDDEGIFFGGTLPYYSAVLKVPTMLLSMTSGDWTPSNLTIREEELRCAAWTYGLRYEPLFPRFRDVPSQSLTPNPYTNKIDATWDYWADGVLQGDGSDVEAGKQKAIFFVAEQIRRYRPEVVITHDGSGEYGHHNHIATAQVVTNAFVVAADPSAAAPNLAGLEPWQAKKLYLHLYPANRLFHRFLETPYSELAFKTPRQVADAGLDCHISQSRPDVSTVYRTGENFDPYPSEWWGLYASTVGPDTLLLADVDVDGYMVPAGVSAGNFLEHLDISHTSGPPVFVADPIRLPAALVQASFSGQTLQQWISDPDLAWGESLTFQKTAGPDWLKVAAGGALSGVPAPADYGTNVFTVRATDSAGLSGDTTLWIDVKGQFPVVADLVGWWRLDEASGPGCADSALPASDGAVTGAVTLNQPAAAAGLGTSALFDGVSAKVDVPWSAELNPQVFSISLWARVLGGTSTFRSPLSSRESVPQSGYVFYAAQNNTWQFWLGATNAWKILSGGPVVTNVWMHLAATYDGTNANFFTNGALAASLAVSFRPNGKFPLRFGSGGSETAGQYWFPGYVDDVRVYTSVLTPQQVAALHTNRPPTFLTDPITGPSVAAGTVGFSESLAAKATDPDTGDSLHFAKLSGPGWLTVQADGTIAGMPLTRDAGLNLFRVGVSDHQGAANSAEFRIEVVPGEAPVFSSIQVQPGGEMALELSGRAGQSYVVEATTDLGTPSWIPLATNTTGEVLFEFLDSNAKSLWQRYYRAVVP